MAHTHTRTVVHPDGLDVGCAAGELAIVSAGARLTLVFTGSVEEYRAALARIADTINKHLDETAPKPEPIKVGDRVMVGGEVFHGKVQEIDDERQFALVTFDGGRWDWCELGLVERVPA